LGIIEVFPLSSFSFIIIGVIIDIIRDRKCITNGENL
jgi:hypothetical protein